MRRQFRVLGAVLTTVLGVGGLSACSLLHGTTFDDDTTLARKITSVRLDNDDGGVTLRGRKDLEKVSVHRKVEYRGDRPEDTAHKVENGTLVLGGCGANCSVDYTVDLPAGLPVTGATSAGAIELSRVGDVDVTTDSGHINLSRITDVAVRTDNGEVTGHGLAGGRIRARTSNGAIKLSPSTPQNVRAQTSNGSITLTVPQAHYRVSAQTDNGDTDIGIPDDPSGAYRLRLETSNGKITVTSA